MARKTKISGVVLWGASSQSFPAKDEQPVNNAKVVVSQSMRKKTALTDKEGGFDLGEFSGKDPISVVVDHINADEPSVICVVPKKDKSPQLKLKLTPKQEPVSTNIGASFGLFCIALLLILIGVYWHTHASDQDVILDQLSKPELIELNLANAEDRKTLTALVIAIEHYWQDQKRSRFKIDETSSKAQWENLAKLRALLHPSAAANETEPKQSQQSKDQKSDAEAGAASPESAPSANNLASSADQKVQNELVAEDVTPLDSSQSAEAYSIITDLRLSIMDRAASYLWTSWPWLLLELWFWGMLGTLIQMIMRVGWYLRKRNYHVYGTFMHISHIVVVPILSVIATLLISLVEIKIAGSEIVNFSRTQTLVVVCFLLAISPWNLWDFILQRSKKLTETTPNRDPQADDSNAAADSQVVDSDDADAGGDDADQAETDDADHESDEDPAEDSATSESKAQPKVPEK